MFEEYLQDTAFFLAEARRAAQEGSEADARRSYRVSVMLCGAAMETFVNYIAGTFETAGSDTLRPYELALLVDKRFGQEKGKFAISNQPAYSRLEDKVRFLIRHFPVKLDPSTSKEWSEFLKFKRHRDDLVHAKRDEDDTPLAEYDATCANGIQATFKVMDLLSEGVFGKRLRAKLQDLVDFSGTT